MDPPSILGISAAVVQFVDFGTKLLSRATEAYRTASGRENANINLAAVAQDVESLCNDVNECSAALECNSLPGSPQETSLQLCRKCKDIAQELNHAISKIQISGVDSEQRCPEQSNLLSVKVKDITWRTFSNMFYAVLSDKKIKELKERMIDTRQQVSLAALVFLWEDVNKQGKTLSQLSQQQLGIMGTLKQIDMTTKNFSQDFHETVATTSNRTSRARQNMIKAVWSSDWNPEPNTHLPETSVLSDTSSPDADQTSQILLHASWVAYAS